MIIDAHGMLVDKRVVAARQPLIERSPMLIVHGIVVHQTDSTTAASTLAQYKQPKSNGAHFLIDKDGTIYQTASVKRGTRHVGILKSRCVMEKSCSAEDLKRIQKLKIRQLSQEELRKPFPKRFPSNADAIGIELVGKYHPQTGYESVSREQNESLQWLVGEVTIALGVQAREIYRHPELSYKQPSEAHSARW